MAGVLSANGKFSVNLPVTVAGAAVAVGAPLGATGPLLPGCTRTGEIKARDRTVGSADPGADGDIQPARVTGGTSATGRPTSVNCPLTGTGTPVCKDTLNDDAQHERHAGRRLERGNSQGYRHRRDPSHGQVGLFVRVNGRLEPPR
ncbi:hypothetical protein [Deinococcus hopiensis]|uniref:hypothetical protein n=1 Tax=Deinococcus hopiensis TaxID=309885 RepID=UPI00111C4233|nr:hypothetical protein [Deinococcus hopiensis]